jgi:hypothetical protein
VAYQAFIDDRVDLMVASDEDLAQRLGQVLVELDLHPRGSSGTSSSRAKAAP